MTINTISANPKLEQAIEQAHQEDMIRELLRFIGDDPTREGLLETPNRFLRAWKFWGSGYGKDPKEVLKTFKDGSENYDEMVFQSSIPFFSCCEHHMAPFFGYVHIAYLPSQKIVGLSKLARLVEIYARRLQVQEKMTGQIVDALMDHLGCRGAAIVTQARHLCMESRGVQKIGTVTVCSALRGVFKTVPEVRAEFMSLVQTAMNGIKIL